MASMQHKRAAVFGLAGLLAALLMPGCAYRLAPPSPPSLHKLKLVTPSPANYAFRVQDKDYQVGADGKVAIQFQTHHGCSVYLFDRIPVSRRRDPLKTKSIFVAPQWQHSQEIFFA
jgi:hypothetical protein